MYLIIGATGHVGSKIANVLLDGGKPVHVISRSMSRLKSLMTKGAIPLRGDVTDTDFLTKAFTGATAVFSMIPPNIKADDTHAYQRKVSESIATAIEKSGVKYVVNLSSIGGQLTDKTGPILGLHDHEEKLNRISGVNVIHLRSAYFMENLMGNMDLIKHQGINGSAIRGDLKMPVIAAKDIAEEAAYLMSNLNFNGKSVKYLLGQRDLSMIEITSIIGKAIGKDNLKYFQFPYEDTKKAMTGMGISDDAADSFIEMYRAFNEELIFEGVSRTNENTTKTLFEDFAIEFAKIYCADNPECQAIGF